MRAAGEGYSEAREGPPPYHGYYFRMLKGQGRARRRRASTTSCAGTTIGGFAVIAYPAKYGNSGIMTFIVNQDGEGLPDGPRAADRDPGGRDHEVRPGSGLDCRAGQVTRSSHSFETTERRHVRKLVLAASFTLAAAAAFPAAAQTGNVVAAKAPGAVGVAQTVNVTATITAIDAATRTCR